MIFILKTGPSTHEARAEASILLSDTGYVVRIFIVCLKLLNHNSLRYILFQKDYRRTGIVCQDVCQILISEKHSRQTETSANLS